MILRKPALFLLVAVFACSAAAQNPKPRSAQLRFEVFFPATLSPVPLDGRVFLMLSTNDRQEPRFQISDRAETQQFFGVDVDALAPGAPAVVDKSVLGYPLDRLEQVPAGDYYVQALLNVYETIHLANGHTVKLPPDRGEGQQWNRKPGNLFSKPQRVQLDPGQGGVIHISLTEKIPPIEPPKDTKYVKHLTLQSKLLSDFWGRPTYLGAIVILPEGFEEHPNARYPLVVNHGHFTYDFRGFRTEPPPPELTGRDRTMARSQYNTYEDWAYRLPHMLLLIIQHANPYYDDSYAVDSANVGPYGAAITQELIPEVERRFRGIGQGWARFLYGGSTGGWEAMAQQVFYPDYFNGAWCACPDPVDFRGYQIVNIYDDANAYWIQGPFGRVPRPAERTANGNIVTTMDRTNRRELVLGTHGRSGEQFNIWQAVYSPVGADGYPKPIWDPLTGAIDHDVARYWREHYDLNYIMQRDWATLGPKLVGKLHLSVGDMDSFYLNNAVRMVQEFMESPKNPYRAADFDFGPLQPHCYSGAPDLPPGPSSRSLLQRIMPKMAERIEKTAPAGADMSWKY